MSASTAPVRIIKRGDDSAGFQRLRDAWRTRVHADTAMTVTQRLIVLRLDHYLNSVNGNAWPSLTTLGEDNGVTERTAINAINKAEELGYVWRSRRGGGRVSNVYHLYLPQVVSSNEAEETAADGPTAAENNTTQPRRGEALFTPKPEAPFTPEVNGHSDEPLSELLNEFPNPLIVAQNPDFEAIPETSAQVTSPRTATTEHYQNQSLTGSYAEFVEYAYSTKGQRHLRNIWRKHGTRGGGGLEHFLQAFAYSYGARQHADDWLANVTDAIKAVNEDEPDGTSDPRSEVVDLYWRDLNGHSARLE